MVTHMAKCKERQGAIAPELAKRIFKGVVRQVKQENEGGDPFRGDQFHVQEEDICS